MLFLDIEIPPSRFSYFCVLLGGSISLTVFFAPSFLPPFQPVLVILLLCNRSPVPVNRPSQFQVKGMPQLFSAPAEDLYHRYGQIVSAAIYKTKKTGGLSRPSSIFASPRPGIPGTVLPRILKDTGGSARAVPRVLPLFVVMLQPAQRTFVQFPNPPAEPS